MVVTAWWLVHVPIHSITLYICPCGFSAATRAPWHHVVASPNLCRQHVWWEQHDDSSVINIPIPSTATSYEGWQSRIHVRTGCDSHSITLLLSATATIMAMRGRRRMKLSHLDIWCVVVCWQWWVGISLQKEEGEMTMMKQDMERRRHNNQIQTSKMGSAWQQWQE